MGIVVSVNVSGYAIGGPLVNVVFDLTGSYMPALLGCAVIMVGVFITMHFVISSANRMKRSIIENQQEVLA